MRAVDLVQMPEQEEEREAVLDELAEQVLDNFRKAQSSRSSFLVQGKTVDDWFVRLENAYNKIHEAEEIQARPNMGSYFGLVMTKINTSVSYMRSKFVSVEKPPFKINPTPIVELPEQKRQQGLEKVKAALLNRLISNNLPPEAILGDDGFMLSPVSQFVKDLSKNIKDEIRKEEYLLAEQAAEKMGKLIKDQLIEGRFSSALSEALFDIALYPVAVLSYENESVVDYVWRKNKYEKINTVRPTFRRTCRINGV